MTSFGGENKVGKKLVLFELFLVLVSLALWGRQFSNKIILLHTDNKDIKFVIVTQLCPYILLLAFFPILGVGIKGQQERRDLPGSPLVVGKSYLQQSVAPSTWSGYVSTWL